VQNDKSSRSELYPLTYREIPGKLKYKPNKEQRTSLHVGQRKLFMNELQFMCRFRPSIVVYAGAAPSMHIWRLHELFPETKFLLVDPNEFCIVKRLGVTHYDDPEGVEYLEVGHDKRDYYNGKQLVNYRGKMVDKETVRGDPFIGDIVLTHPITIIENIFTMDLAHRVKKLGRVSFWSDIRTNMYDDKPPSELDLYWNSAQQLAWVNIIKPESTMLKFRCPYLAIIQKDIELNEHHREYFDYCKGLGVDFLEDYKTGRFRYIDGDVYLQPWAPGSSTEGRLVFTDVKIVDWDSIEYEERFYYYNNVTRLGKYYGHEVDPTHYIDRCGDCALEAKIWSEYTKNVLQHMQTLGNYMGVHGRTLFAKMHGKLY
jgi:hypothetical protein